MLAQVSQRSGRCLIPGNIPGQVSCEKAKSWHRTPYLPAAGTAHGPVSLLGAAGSRAHGSQHQPLYFSELCKKSLLMAVAEDAFPATRQATGEIKTASFSKMSYCLRKHSQI